MLIRIDQIDLTRKVAVPGLKDVYGFDMHFSTPLLAGVAILVAGNAGTLANVIGKQVKARTGFERFSNPRLVAATE
jgi:hypothetical protein